MLQLFFVGIAEMIIIAVWTKEVSDAKIVPSGLITFVNIMVWYYVLQRIVEDLGNWQQVALYAIGCSIGTMIGTWYYHLKDKYKNRKSRKTSV